MNLDLIYKRQKLHSLLDVLLEKKVSFLLAIVTAWCMIWFIHTWHYWEDDAYIHLEFARSVAAGAGFAFNGHVVNGDTSPLWVLLLAGFHALFGNWIPAGKLLAIVGTIFTLVGSYYFSVRLVTAKQSCSIFAAAMVLLLVVNPYFNYWDFSGMEAVTAAGLALWATLAATARPSWKNILLGCFLAGIGPLLRPEMLFLVGILSVVLLWQWYQMNDRKASIRNIAGFLLGVVLLVLPTLLWAHYALHAFGSIVPNTNAAKRAAPGDSVSFLLLEIYMLAFPVVFLGILTIAALLMLRRYVKSANGKEVSSGMPPLAAWVFFVWSAMDALFYIKDHTHVQTRYILLTAPGLMFAVFALLYEKLTIRLFRVYYVLALALGVTISSIATWPEIRNKVAGDRATDAIALYVRNNIPQDDPVAVYGIGQIAFVSQHPVIDTGGITRASAIPLLNGTEADMLAWAKGQGAKYFISGDRPGPGAVPIFVRWEPNVGLSLNPRYYKNGGNTTLWKLP